MRIDRRLSAHGAVFGMVLGCALLVAGPASAAISSGASLGGVASASAAGLGSLLGTMTTWITSHVQEVLVIGSVGAGLVLIFNKNFMQLAETVAWVGMIAGFFALIIGGLGSGAAGALVP